MELQIFVKLRLHLLTHNLHNFHHIKSQNQGLSETVVLFFYNDNVLHLLCFNSASASQHIKSCRFSIWPSSKAWRIWYNIMIPKTVSDLSFWCQIWPNYFINFLYFVDVLRWTVSDVSCVYTILLWSSQNHVKFEIKMSSLFFVFSLSFLRLFFVFSPSFFQTFLFRMPDSSSCKRFSQKSFWSLNH